MNYNLMCYGEFEEENFRCQKCPDKLQCVFETNYKNKMKADRESLEEEEEDE